MRSVILTVLLVLFLSACVPAPQTVVTPPPTSTLSPQEKFEQMAAEVRESSAYIGERRWMENNCLAEYDGTQWFYTGHCAKWVSEPYVYDVYHDSYPSI